MHPALWLALAICSEIVATVSLKLSDGFTRPIPAVVVVVGYALSFYALSISLRTIPLGVVYAIWSGVGTAAVVLIGLFLFREALDAAKVIGIGLIIAGVVTLNGVGAATAQ
jgi:small multidrug resistance pump